MPADVRRESRRLLARGVGTERIRDWPVKVRGSVDATAAEGARDDMLLVAPCRARRGWTPARRRRRRVHHFCLYWQSMRSTAGGDTPRAVLVGKGAGDTRAISSDVLQAVVKARNRSFIGSAVISCPRRSRRTGVGRAGRRTYSGGPGRDTRRARRGAVSPTPTVSRAT